MISDADCQQIADMYYLTVYLMADGTAKTNPQGKPFFREFLPRRPKPTAAQTTASMGSVRA